MTQLQHQSTVPGDVSTATPWFSRGRIIGDDLYLSVWQVPDAGAFPFSIDKGRAPLLHCRVGRLRIMWWEDAASRKLAPKRPVLRPGKARGVRWVFEFLGAEALWCTR